MPYPLLTEATWHCGDGCRREMSGCWKTFDNSLPGLTAHSRATANVAWTCLLVYDSWCASGEMQRVLRSRSAVRLLSEGDGRTQMRTDPEPDSRRAIHATKRTVPQSDPHRINIGLLVHLFETQTADPGVGPTFSSPNTTPAPSSKIGDCGGSSECRRADLQHRAQSKSSRTCTKCWVIQSSTSRFQRTLGWRFLWPPK